MSTSSPPTAAAPSAFAIPFLDLRIADPVLRREILEATEATLDHGRFVRGAEIDEFELALASYCGTRFAVGVGSGSVAIFVALRALGIGPGDEVVTTSLSFVGTALGIAMTGATPVFADISPDLTMAPTAAEALITRRTRAVMPVHFTGRPCDMVSLRQLCDTHGVALVEDAAPAIGAEVAGRRAGSFGAAGCLSINPMKILGALGEAGAVLTDDPTVRERAIALRYNGMISPEQSAYVSTNARLDTLQAAILLRLLPRLEAVIARRREIAAFYTRGLHDVVDVPDEPPDGRSVFYTYTIQTDARDDLAAFLADRGIETKVQHPYLLPEHPVFGGQDVRHLAVADRARRRLLCLPVHEKLSDAQVEAVAEAVRAFAARRG
jgi:dTDP-4-amino-4,6-dideoxygalactose transaminase